MLKEPPKVDLRSVPFSKELKGVLEEGTEFEGRLCFQGTVRVSGRFKGEIFTPDTLIIGETGRVEGSVEAGVVIIGGSFSGTVRAKYRVEIHRPAVFRGEVHAPSLRVDEGVVFEGESRMVQPMPKPQASILGPGAPT